MAAWITANQRSNLMQNCDLPPPLKLFSGPDETFLSSISKIYTIDCGKASAKDDGHRDSSGENKKLELLKALQLSQTRAREAGRKIMVLSKEKEVLSNLLIHDSLRLCAHRRWVSLTELQVLKLKRKQQEAEEDYAASCRGDTWGDGDDDDDDGGRMWCAALAFCLAAAGVGFAFGCRYLF